MPIPFAAITAGMQVAGGVMSFMGSKSAAEDAKELADEQARLNDLQSAFDLKRMGQARGRELGYAKAATYASNTLNQGSAAQFQREMREQWNQDMGWERTKTRMESALIRKGGRQQADSIRRQGMTDLIGGITGAASTVVANGGIPGLLGSDDEGWFLGKNRGVG